MLNQRFSSLLLAAAAAMPMYAASAPAIDRVTNGVSYTTQIARGSIIAIFGSDLAGTPVVAATVPLPVKLGETSVLAGTKALPLYYVSPQQINSLIPADVPTRTVANSDGSVTEFVDLTVSTGGLSSRSVAVQLAAFAPAVFSKDSTGTGEALAITADFRLAKSLTEGDWLVLYATGMGAMDSKGWCVAKPRLRVGGKTIDVAYAGDSGYAGVYQVNAKLPAGLGTDGVYLVGANEGETSDLHYQPLHLPLAASNAATDVHASVEITALDAVATFSPWVVGGRLGLSFVVPTAGKAFDVVVKLEHTCQPLMSLHVDPAAGTAKISYVDPTAAERAGDFSQSGGAIDLLSGLPFPGGIIPASRWMPVASLFSSLPLPNNGTHGFTTTVPAPPGVKFDLAASGAPVSFAAWVPVAGVSGKEFRDAVVVYVDGRRVASKDAVIPLQ